MDEEKTLQERVQEWLDSEQGQDIKTILAYAIKSTKTTKDDEIVSKADEIATVVAENLSEIANTEVSNKDFKTALMRQLKWAAEQTSNKWDDRIVSIIDMFV